MYLSEEDLRSCDWSADFPLITCGTGSGKTTFVVKGDLQSYVEKQTGKQINFVLLLVPTDALKKDILKTYPSFTTYLDPLDLLEPNTDRRVRIACFAQLAKFLKDGNTIRNFPGLIVFDEIDCLVQWALVFRGYVETWEYLLSKRVKTFLCGITATPRLLLDFFPQMGFVDLTPDFPVQRRIEEIEVIEHSTASTYLKTLDLGIQKAIVYVRSAKECKRLASAFGERAGYVISKHNKTIDPATGKELGALSEEQKVSSSAFGEANTTLREYLIDNNKLPEEIDVLFINDCMNAGFSLKDETIGLVIAETCDLSVLLQVIGRVRTSLSKCVAIYNLKEKQSFLERYQAEQEIQANKNEQGFLKAVYLLQEMNRNDSEALVYQCGNSFKINPFADGVYRYQMANFERLNNSEEYFSCLASFRCEPVFVSGKSLSANARNKAIQSKLDVPQIFDLKDGQTSKFVTAKDLKQIANTCGLRFDNGKPYGKEKFIETINDSEQWVIRPLGQKRIQGVKASWYELSKNGGQG